MPSSVACGTPPRVICVSVRGSERQQGGRLTYTLHSFRFCAESVLTAVDRAGSTATCGPQSTRRRVDPSLRTLDQPQRSQPPPPESAPPTICATRWSATSRVRRLCGERYQRGGPACSRQRPGSGDQFTASQAGSSATTGHSASFSNHKNCPIERVSKAYTCLDGHHRRRCRRARAWGGQRRLRGYRQPK